MSPRVPSAALDRYRFLQAILCCPVTKGPLTLAGLDDFLSSLSEADRQRVQPGTIGAFISVAADRAYPLTERVANFLPRDSFAIRAQAREIAPATPDDDIMHGVKEWYDRFGWKTNESGLYMDSALFSQNRPEGHGLYEMMSHLSILERLPRGEFLLDAASGAIAHPEYLAFSWFYRCRVCVDISQTALLEADGKLRQSDFCCLADICNLPFRDGTFDGAVSGYTIQHVPESGQLPALRELYRVIKPGTHLCIFTSVEYSRLRGRLVSILKSLRKRLKTLGLFRPPPAISCNPETPGMSPPHPLYCFLRKAAWWKAAAREFDRHMLRRNAEVLEQVRVRGIVWDIEPRGESFAPDRNHFSEMDGGSSFYCLVDLRKPARGSDQTG